MTRLPPLELGAHPLTLHELRRGYRDELPGRIHQTAFKAVRESHPPTSKPAAGEAPAYGINTGFGLLAQTRIPASQRELLQKNIILSHSAGVGPLLDDSVVRLVLVLKLASLLQGFSGVSEELVRFLEKIINSGWYPCIPSQ